MKPIYILEKINYFNQNIGSINYPPEKIYSPSKLKRPNYDHILLWMLYNNDICEWVDFCQEPISIPTGTLSRHLDKLKRKGFVENLNYPPKIILGRGRNYSQYIF